MGRKKSVPGPLTLVQPVAAASAPASAPNHSHHSPLHSQLPSQSHSAKPVPTLGLLGETQRLSPEAASISISTSTSTGLSTTTTASPSLSSVSPKSPYTSKFSPRNLTYNPHNRSPLSSPLSSPAPPQLQLQPRPQPPPSQPPPSIPRQQAVPQPHSHSHPIPNHSQRSQPAPTSAPTNFNTDQSSQQRLQATFDFYSHSQSQSQSPASPTPSDSKQPHIAELQQRLPPITKSVTASSHQQTRQYHQSERRLKSSHDRRHADDDRYASVSSPNHHGPTQHKDHRQGFFFNFSTKSAKSHEPLPPLPSRHQAAQQSAQSQQTCVAMNAPDQPATTTQNTNQPDTAHATSPSLPSRSETSLGNGDSTSNPTPTKKASKPKPFTLLRTRSQREKVGRSPRHTPSPQDTKDTVAVPTPTTRGARVPIMELNPPDRAHGAQTPRTAAIAHDPAYREAMSSSSRNHSADRAHSRETSSDRRGHHERDNHSRSHQSTPRDANGASSFFNNLRREGGRVAETIGKGLFGKSRSASTTEREPVDDEHYVLKVINLPLVEQTRLTRISKRLEESRDKTEFWMPAFPWRAIDYLNYKGCDVEGLYRVPGSGPQIKKWQRRFDEQHDVDLFTQEDLYDINIIGSMLKAWLRELPDELFPKEAQTRIARECAGSEKVPQMLIDELSNLSPFNYYLLFAITCHLSLLLAHSDKNKMDFRNLCICFQPCMKIDAFCFRFLVCDWRDCWKGCRTEARYIEEEYKLFDQPPPPGLGIKKRMETRIEGQPNRRPSPAPDLDERERTLSSADSNGKRLQHSGDQARLKKKSPPPQENGRENGTAIAVPRTVHTELEVPGASPRGSNDRGPSSRDANDMRPLSPIKPLSPLGF